MSVDRSVVSRWLLYTLLPLAGWFIYWCAFFPGLVMWDSLMQWKQVLAGHYDDSHPAFHTWTIWLVTRGWHSLGAVSLLQVVITAGLIGYALVVLRRLRVPAWIVWLVWIWLTVSPVVGLNVIAVWKDSAYTAAVLWSTLLILGCVERGRLGVRAGLGLGSAFALVWLFRHNGPLLVLPTLALLAWHFRVVSRRGIATVVLVTAALVGTVKGPLYHWLGVQPPAPIIRDQLVIHHIAGLIEAGTPLTPAERERLELLMPLGAWRSAYRCNDVTEISFRSGLRVERLDQDRGALLATWARLATRNPRAELAHWACASRFVWVPSSWVYVGPFFPDGGTVDPNDLGVATTPLLAGAHMLLTQVIWHTLAQPSWLRAVLWSPAPYLYLVVAALCWVLWKGVSLAPLLVWSPVLCNTLTWLLLAGHWSFRYQWPMVLEAPFLVALAAGDGRWASPGKNLPTPRQGA